VQLSSLGPERPYNCVVVDNAWKDYPVVESDIATGLGAQATRQGANMDHIPT